MGEEVKVRVPGVKFLRFTILQEYNLTLLGFGSLWLKFG